MVEIGDSNKLKNNKMRRIVNIIVAAAAFGVFLGSCNQKVPNVGVPLLPDSVTLHGFTGTNLVTDVSSIYRRFAQFNDGTMFLGKAGNTEAISCVRFVNIPDSLGNLTEADIESVTLSLQPLRYVLGDSVQNRLSCNVVEVLMPYSDTTKIDYIKQPGFFDTKTIATIDAQIPLKDTVDAVETNFDKSVIIKWLQRKQQFKNDTLTYGIAFRDNGSTVMRRFSTQSIADLTAPLTKLKIRYRKPGNTNIDTMTWESGNDATFTDAPLGESGAITVHGSVAVDGVMSFDISALPAGVAVHLAKLTLTLDPSRTIAGNFGPDSLVGARFIDSSNSTNLAHDYFGYRAAGTQKYVFPLMNSAVDGMLRRQGKGTLLLRPESKFDIHQCNRLVFFGNTAPDTTVRPLLEVIYSTRPKIQP